jgi:hypothetical protein
MEERLKIRHQRYVTTASKLEMAMTEDNQWRCIPELHVLSFTYARTLVLSEPISCSLFFSRSHKSLRICDTNIKVCV